MDRETDLNSLVARDCRQGEGATEMAWKEHGWGLNARHVAILVGTIIALSALIPFFAIAFIARS